MNTPKTPFYLIDDAGNFRFTRTGMEDQGVLLQMAGIDPRSITTYEQYKAARKQASPYFLEFLKQETEKRFKGDKNSLEFQVLQAIISGPEEEYQRLLKKLKQRNKLKDASKDL